MWRLQVPIPILLRQAVSRRFDCILRDVVGTLSVINVNHKVKSLFTFGEAALPGPGYVVAVRFDGILLGMRPCDLAKSAQADGKAELMSELVQAGVVEEGDVFMTTAEHGRGSVFLEASEYPDGPPSQVEVARPFPAHVRPDRPVSRHGDLEVPLFQDFLELAMTNLHRPLQMTQWAMRKFRFDPEATSISSPFRLDSAEMLDAFLRCLLGLAFIRLTPDPASVAPRAFFDLFREKVDPSTFDALARACLAGAPPACVADTPVINAEDIKVLPFEARSDLQKRAILKCAPSLGVQPDEMCADDVGLGCFTFALDTVLVDLPEIVSDDACADSASDSAPASDGVGTGADTAAGQGGSAQSAGQSAAPAPAPATRPDIEYAVFLPFSHGQVRSYSKFSFSKADPGGTQYCVMELVPDLKWVVHWYHSDGRPLRDVFPEEQAFHELNDEGYIHDHRRYTELVELKRVEKELGPRCALVLKAKSLLLRGPSAEARRHFAIVADLLS